MGAEIVSPVGATGAAILSGSLLCGGTQVPAGPDWIHEIKHDGYRLIVRREGKRVRLFTRNGHDWTDRFPLIAALRLRKTSFVIDGEAVVLGPEGVSDFDALHGGKRDADVRLYAFDLLADDGADMRGQPLHIRKQWLGKLLKRSGDGILYNDHEAGAIGPRLFERACKMGLEGIGSKLVPVRSFHPLLLMPRR